MVHHNPSNYSEQVVVNKARLNITASNGEDVTVQTTGSNTGFSVNNVNNVTISGFRVQGTDHTQGTGISLSNANYCTIINNIINSYWKGVSVTGSNNNISNNKINDTTIGTSLIYQSNNNTISYNNITNPTYNPDTEVRLGLREDGMYFGSWTPNQFNKYLNNIISNVNEGIFIQQGTNFNISGNTITIKNTFNYPWAITLSVGNTANQVDILSKNTIISEGPSSNGRGIYLISNPSSPANAIMQIFSNYITNFGDGIYSILYTPTGTSLTQLYLNRFYNNAHGLSIASSTAFIAINNWWGKNTGPTVYTSSPPAIYDIFDDHGTVTYDPWIVLNINVNPSSISTGSSSTVTADLTKNSNNQDTSILYPGQYVPDGTLVNFSSDSLGNVIPSTSITTNGLATTTFNAGNLPGVSFVSTTVDAQTVSGIINIIGTPVSTAIAVNPVTGVSGSLVNLVATLTDTLNNVPIQGRTIDFSIGGTSIGSAITDINGIATYLNYQITQGIGTYTILASFAGDTTYVSSSNTNNLNVLDALSVTSTDPVNKAIDVGVNKVVNIVFNRNIKMGTNPWIEFKTAAGTAITFTTSIVNNVLSLTPTSFLTPGTAYTVIIHSYQIADLNGIPLTTPYTTTFTTTQPPVVTSTNPVNKATNVGVNKVVNIIYNKNIKMGTNPWIEFKTAAGTAITFTTSIVNNVLSLTPTSLLTPGTAYTVIIHSYQITDLSGAPQTTPYTTTFTTTQPPVVTSTDPVNNAVNVATNKIVKFNFNKTIKLATNPWIEFKTSSGTAKPFTLSVTGSTLNITPTTALSKATNYTVIVHSNAVTDSSGAAQAKPYSTKFKTA